jgi:hypothetical protein
VLKIRKCDYKVKRASVQVTGDSLLWKCRMKGVKNQLRIGFRINGFIASGLTIEGKGMGNDIVNWVVSKYMGRGNAIKYRKWAVT